MTAITQKIRRFTGGISDQPDEQKIPGQVRDAVNCVPDVVQGLIKRPGMNLVNELDTDKEGKWFFIDKANNFNDEDRYVGKIDNRKTLPNPDDPDNPLDNPNKGKVQVWDLKNGKLMDVCYTDNIDPLDLNPSAVGYELTESQRIYSDAYSCEGYPIWKKNGDGKFLDANGDVIDDPNDMSEEAKENGTGFYARVELGKQDPHEEYFIANDPLVDDLQVLTINDYTFITNRKVPVQMSDNKEEKKPPQATVELRSIAGLTTYELRFERTLDPAPPTVVTATKIAVSVAGLNTTPEGAPPGGPAFGNYGTCAANVSERIQNISGENSGSEGEGLDITLTTSSEIVVTRTSTPRAGFNSVPVITTPKCVYTTTVSINSGGDGWKVGDSFRRVYNGATYQFVIKEVAEVQQGVLIGEVSATTERENPKADDVLDSLINQIRALGFTAKRIGNSIWLQRDEAFTVTTPNSILLRVLSSTNVGTKAEPNYVIQANDVDQLPLQTKHNLVFQVRNTYSDVDDYYVQFKGDNNLDGTGTYVEVAKPGIPNLFMPDTMPHGILRLSKTYPDEDGDVIRTFLVASFDWAARQAGDDLTVPRPSFAPEEGATFGRPINQLAFFRNRLIMLTDENVVASVAGDFFNFWAKTATTITPSDPIDLQVSNNYPAVLYGAQATTSGLLLFSENAQFMFGTENDVLEPRTARTSQLSTYSFNRNSNPVSLGTTVGFVSGIGRYTRFYEMANVSRDQEPEVVEQSKVIERLIPGGYQYVGISKDNQIVAFGQDGLDEVWIFRYFNTGERRAQSSWVRWKLTGDLVNHALINDSYFAVVSKDDRVFLQRGDVRALQSTIMLEDEEDEKYRTFLDYATAVEEFEQAPRNRLIIDPAEIGFPVFEGIVDKVVTVVWDPKEEQGYIVPANYKNGKFSIRSNIPDQKIFIGYVYEMHIDLPKFYVKKEQNGQADSWDTANVIVQRVKLNFGRIGYYETTLKRLGRDDYTQIYESKPMDKYDANEIGYLPDYEQTTPVYQRNTGFTMSISSEHPSPAVLYSATWEGQYQENYVKRL